MLLIDPDRSIINITLGSTLAVRKGGVGSIWIANAPMEIGSRQAVSAHCMRGFCTRLRAMVFIVSLQLKAQSRLWHEAAKG